MGPIRDIWLRVFLVGVKTAQPFYRPTQAEMSIGAIISDLHVPSGQAGLHSEQQPSAHHAATGL